MNDHQKMAEDLSKECRKLVGQIIIKHDHAIIEQLHSEVGAYKAKIATLEEWLEDLKSQLKEREWISVDSAPKDGDEILLYSMGDVGVCYWRDDDFDGKGSGWTWGCSNRFNNPTHWMPLPSPPTEKDNG